MMKNKKLKIGEYFCCTEDLDIGNFNTPAEITFDIKCIYLDKDFVAYKCHYEGECDFKDEVNMWHVRNFPDLFKEK